MAEADDKPDLTHLANLYGTDKGTNVGHGHAYTLVYELLFAPLRHRPLRILEIGLQAMYLDRAVGHKERRITGVPSINMWRDYFPEATFVGFDRDDFSAFAGDRFTFVQGDQADAADLARLAEHGPFDIIIDDGPHGGYHQQLALATLFPRLQPDGLYLIEDLQARPPAGRPYRTHTTDTLLGHYLAYGAFPDAPDMPSTTFDTLGDTIQGIFLFPGGLLPGMPIKLGVLKKTGGENGYVRATRLLPLSWNWEKMGNAGKALATAAAAAEKFPDDPFVSLRYSRALFSNEQPKEAVRVLEAMNPGALNHMAERPGLALAAEPVFRAAVKLAPGRPLPKKGLALALSAQGRTGEADTVWQSISASNNS